MKSSRSAVLTLLALLLFCVDPTYAETDGGPHHLYEPAFLPGETRGDVPLRSCRAGLRGDTTWYGQYEIIEGKYFARAFDSKHEGRWTFDRGTGPIDSPAPLIENGEGWSTIDETENRLDLFRVIDETLDLGPGVPPPIIGGDQSLWVGVDAPQAESLCYACDAGYGNSMNQRCTSEPLAYSGSGNVTLTFLYFCYTEPCYDGVQIYLKRADESELLLNPYPGECPGNVTYTGGSFTDSIGHYSAPATYTRVVTAEEIGGAQVIGIIFEFTSDGGWSDEDCEFPSIWGPFGADNVSITGGGIDVFYDFEDGLQGWTPAPGPGKGSYAGIADIEDYAIEDACQCKLEGNILEMHDGIGDAGFHPVGQYETVLSPICDLGPGESREVFMEFDMYAEMPRPNGVLHRPGWKYYPYVDCNGATVWSPRVGQEPWDYMGDDPVCYTWRFGGTKVNQGIPVPPDAEMVIAILQLMADCEAFAIEDCSDETNFTPLFDNIAVATAPSVRVPVVDFDTGTYFQDVGSFPSTLFDPVAPGPANIVMDTHFDDEMSADLCGDTLVVAGPQPGSDPNSRWEARLWWRVARRAPFQADYEGGYASRYKIWKDRVSDGYMIDRPDRPEFAWAWMDSVQIGYVVLKNKFSSCFRENDDDFAGEGNPTNEIIWDDVLYPGSRIEYFVTSNYTTTPDELYYLPDTSGGNFYEFEILPGLMTTNAPDCGGLNRDFCVFLPSTLYIDAYGRGSQIFIENALRTVLNGLDPCLEELGCDIPRDRAWDRYDYGDACSCWNAPFMRGSIAGSNNGMTLDQILGYRTILVNSGSFGVGNMHDPDFQLLSQWLTASECDANANRQVVIMNGDKCGELLMATYPPVYGGTFLNTTLGATLFCDQFNGVGNDTDCGEVNRSFCVRLLAVEDGAFGTELDIDAWGSYCPNLFGFNTYNLNGGTGNRSYHAENGLKAMDFAQVTNENLAEDANYRTVLSSPSWDHMTSRDAGGQDMGLCPRDLPSIVAAEIAEIGAALKWGHDAPDYQSIPKLSGARGLAECQETWEAIPSELVELTTVRINRLYQNEPNPFNPVTTIRFSLARPGQVEIAIYDVNGRLVRELVDEKKDAGLHTVIWDGLSDAGKQVGSGVYWSQMRVGAFISNKKMIVLK